MLVVVDEPSVGKPRHLRHAIVTPIPYPWRADGGVQGRKKMFCLDPLDRLPTPREPARAPALPRVSA